MARRRSAATGEEDARCPTLKFIIEKGPLEGLSTDYKPGTRVRVGRVARGNTLAVKDAGVSSKHFLIQVESSPDGGGLGWTLTDLGSSNGTFLNGEQLEESNPALLSDGDVIKIGELTSIKVKFEPDDEQTIAGSTSGRRNARRGRGRAAVPELLTVDENSELGLGFGDNCAGNVKDLGPKSVNEKSEDLGNRGEKLGAAVKEDVRGTRTRRSKTVGETEKEMENTSLRRTRSSQKEEKMENLVAKLDEDDDKSGMSEVEVKQGKKVSKRATRNSKSSLRSLENSNADEDKDLGLNKVKGEERVSSRRTRSSTGEAGVDLSIIEGKRKRIGTRGRKKVLVEIPEDKESNFENTICEEEEEESKVGAEKLGESVTSGREGITELGSTSGIKEDTTDIQNPKVVVDLDKMTMGEWFDFLEDFLPKQIVDETEKMISEMRQKAERLHEYMLHQKKG